VSTAEKPNSAIKEAAQKPKKNTKPTKPEPTAEETAQLEAELAELLSTIKDAGEMRWDDELHYGWADDSTAKRLAEVQAYGKGGNTLAWDPTASGTTRGDSGAWRTWDGNRWALDTSNKQGRTYGKIVAHTSRARYKMWNDILKAAKKNGGMSKEDWDFVKDKAAAWHGYSQKVGNTLGINSGLTLLQSEPGMTPNVEWDNNPNLLVTPCGTIELSSDFSGDPEIREARREDWNTRSTTHGLTQDQYNDGPVPKRFEKLLEESLPNPDVRRYFQKTMGYCLFGENNEQKLICLWGESGSGKTTLMQIFAGVLGEYASTYTLSLFRTSQDEKARPDIVRAMKSRLIYASETSKQWKLDADQLKRMTGGDTVTARLNHGNEYYEGVPPFTPVLATNAPPTITGVDEAVWRRLLVFWFPNKITGEQVDSGLAKRIVRDEGPAVLAWLLDGYKAYANGDWLVDGCGQWLPTGEWATDTDGNRTWIEDGGETWIENEAYVEPGLADMPTDVINATMRFRGQLSTSDEYINSDTVTRDTGNRDVHQKGIELYQHYKQWCTDTGVDKADTYALFRTALDRNGHADGWFGPKEKRYQARIGIQTVGSVAVAG
jgi:P4 family phage/plasmid primase-like protien